MGSRTSISKRLVSLFIGLLLSALPAIVAASSEQVRPLVVSIDHTWKPFSFINRDQQPDGLLVDLWKALSLELQRPVEFKLVNWNESIENVRNGIADVHGGLFLSDRRDEFLDFSTDLLPLSTRLFVSHQLNVSSVDELRNIEVGVTRGAYQQEFLKANYPGIRLRTFDNNPLMVKAAVDNEILAFVSIYPVAMYSLSTLNAINAFQSVDTLYTRSLKIAVREGNHELLKQINRAIKSLGAREKQRITLKWVNTETTIPWWVTYLPVILLVGLPVVGILVYMLILKKQVVARTASLEQEINERQSVESALLEMSRRYQSAITLSMDGVFVAAHDGHLIDANQSYSEMSGYSREELLSMRIRDLEAKEAADEVKGHIQKVIENGGDFFETVHRRKDGSIYPVEISVTYSGGDQGYLFAFVRNIFERRVSELREQLRARLSRMNPGGELEKILRSALDDAESLTQSEIGFFHFLNADEENLSLQAWSTRTLNEMCFAEGKGLHYPVDEAGIWVDAVRQRQAVIFNDYRQAENKKGLPEGHARLLRLVSVPIFRDQKIVAVIGVGNKIVDYNQRDVEVVEMFADMAYDFVERERAKRRIEHMAYFDSLTNLPNRDLLSDRLNQAVAQHRRANKILAVCFLDLDGFKPVNDAYGHPAGDQVLMQVAERLQEIMRQGDTLARLGGDEFVMLLTNLNTTEGYVPIVQRVLDAIAKPFDVQDHQLNLSASIGITLYPMDDSNSDTLIRHADQAMYQIKSSGKAGYRVYDPVAELKLIEQNESLADIVRGFEAGEFELYYQPRIDLRNGQVVSTEALIRWQHPHRGLLPPSAFLPLIQGGDLEITLGEWVIESAIRQVVEWHQRGIELPVSVNVTPYHIQQQDFAGNLQRILQRFPDLKPQMLELEVLETSDFSDINQTSKTMKACCELGVSFSMDDFGTGYSSLAYFQRLPIDILKIDQNFVRSMIDDVNDLNIVEGVLNLSHTIDRPVVAEGVENAGLALILINLGCQFAQGFGIAKPMPADQVADWLNRWNSDHFWKGVSEATVDDPAHMQLRAVIYNHVRWCEAIQAGVLAGEGALQRINEAKNLFTRWYHGSGKTRYGDCDSFPFIPPRFNLIADIARSLVSAYKSGKKKKLRRLLVDLEQQNRIFIEILEKLALCDNR